MLPGTYYFTGVVVGLILALIAGLLISIAVFSLQIFTFKKCRGAKWAQFLLSVFATLTGPIVFLLFAFLTISVWPRSIIDWWLGTLIGISNRTFYLLFGIELLLLCFLGFRNLEKSKLNT